MIKNGTKFKLIKDQLGSIRLVVNTLNGTIKANVEYDEFGRIDRDTKLRPNFVAFGFAGGLRDPGSGLVRFGARDYDPQIGRWTAKDPIGFGGRDSNIYRYAANDPVNIIDPSGKILPLAVVLGAGLAVGVISFTGAVVSGASPQAAVRSGLAGFIVGATGGLGALATTTLGTIGAISIGVGGATAAFTLEGGDLTGAQRAVERKNKINDQIDELGCPESKTSE